MRIAVVVGARPQLIKAAPLCRALAAREVESLLVHTGQHFDRGMSEVFFEELALPPVAVHLGVSRGSHGDMTGRMLIALEPVLREADVDWVVVLGDTNSTVAGALATAKLPVPLAHVEAGLRSWNRSMPEEVNRIVADHLAALCFAPTDAALANLSAEGIDGDRVLQTGDVMLDAARLFTPAPRAGSDVLARLDLDPLGFVLATIHRAENTDDPARLRAVMEGLDQVAQRLPVVLPLHPRTAGALSRAGIDPGSIRTIEPLGYLDMLVLESTARVVATDSGGVQKEAFFQGRQCVTLRDETEWVELVELGWNRLVPPNHPDRVARGVLDALDAGPGQPAEPYGDGHAAERMVDALTCR